MGPACNRSLVKVLVRESDVSVRPLVVGILLIGDREGFRMRNVSDVTGGLILLVTVAVAIAEAGSFEYVP